MEPPEPKVLFQAPILDLVVVRSLLRQARRVVKAVTASELPGAETGGYLGWIDPDGNTLLIARIGTVDGATAHRGFTSCVDMGVKVGSSTATSAHEVPLCRGTARGGKCDLRHGDYTILFEGMTAPLNELIACSIGYRFGGFSRVRVHEILNASGQVDLLPLITKDEL